MSKREKLLARARRNPRNLSLEEFESLVNAYGHIEEGGSHPKAIIRDFTLPYKRQNPVKGCYTNDLIEIIDSIEKNRKTKYEK